MLRNIKKKFCLFLLAIILLVSGFYAGTSTKTVEQQVDKINSKEVQAIAVVNLDEGVDVNNQRINYSTKMVEYPNNKYRTASLEEARKGIENGNFAAYIIIPSDFSVAVESLNTTFDQANIEYAFNPNLSDETELLVQQNINKFEEILNFNISYVYVSAVLNEFHDAQDSTTTIMKNDNEELLNVTSVDSDKLIVSMENFELGYVENDIEELDFTELYKNNTELGIKVGMDIKDNLKIGIKDFEKVQLGNEKVTSTSTDFKNVVTLYNPLINGNGEKILDKSEENLLAEIHDYSDEIDENKIKLDLAMRNEIRKFSEQVVVDQLNEKKAVWDIEVNNELDLIRNEYQNEINKKLNENKTATQIEVNNKLNLIKNEIIAQVNVELASVSGNQTQIDPDSITVDAIVLGDQGIVLQDSNINLSTQTVSSNVIQTAVSNNSLSDNYYTAIDDVIKVIDTTKIREIIKEEFKEQITDENSRQQKVMDVTRKNLFANMSIYENELEKYDPFLYVKDEEIDKTVDGINENIKIVQENQIDKDEEYRDYVEEVYKMTEENTDSISEASETAQDKTALNIVTAMQSLKDSRTKINTQNVTLLKDFSDKLSYTRVGSLGNTDAYEFIISPVLYEKNMKFVADKKKEINYNQYIFYGIIMMIFLTTGLIVSNFVSVKAVVNKPD